MPKDSQWPQLSGAVPVARWHCHLKSFWAKSLLTTFGTFIYTMVEGS
jgi:hypothetical protein